MSLKKKSVILIVHNENNNRPTGFRVEDGLLSIRVLLFNVMMIVTCGKLQEALNNTFPGCWIGMGDLISGLPRIYQESCPQLYQSRLFIGG